MSTIREVSARIAEAVIQVARREDLSSAELPLQLDGPVEGAMYQPVYSSYV